METDVKLRQPPFEHHSLSYMVLLHLLLCVLLMLSSTTPTPVRPKHQLSKFGVFVASVQLVMASERGISLTTAAKRLFDILISVSNRTRTMASYHSKFYLRYVNHIYICIFAYFRLGPVQARLLFISIKSIVLF